MDIAMQIGRKQMEGVIRLFRAAVRSFFATAAARSRRFFAAADVAAAVPAAAGDVSDEKEAQNREVAGILDQYGNSILRLAYSYLHNESDAEEVLQDTMIRFLQKAPSFESEQHQKAWLLKVAANLSKNRIDYNRMRNTDELDEELISEERSDLSFVWEAVKALPVRYREVIHLFYYEGYQTAEIAAILHENEATVRSHLKRGREKLKDVLKEAYDFDKI